MLRAVGVLENRERILDDLSSIMCGCAGDFNLNFKVGAVSLPLLEAVLDRVTEENRCIGSIQVHVLSNDDNKVDSTSIAQKLLRVVRGSISIAETKKIELNIEDVQGKSQAEIEEKIQCENEKIEKPFSSILTQEHTKLDKKPMLCALGFLQSQIKIVEKGSPSEIVIRGEKWEEDGPRHIEMRGESSDELFEKLPLEGLANTRELVVCQSNCTDGFFHTINEKLKDSLDMIELHSLPNVTEDGVNSLKAEKLKYLSVKNCPEVSLPFLLSFLSDKQELKCLKLEIHSPEEFHAVYKFIQDQEAPIKFVSLDFHFDSESLEGEKQELTDWYQRENCELKFNTGLNRGEVYGSI